MSNYISVVSQGSNFCTTPLSYHFHNGGLVKKDNSLEIVPYHPFYALGNFLREFCISLDSEGNRWQVNSSFNRYLCFDNS